MSAHYGTSFVNTYFSRQNPLNILTSLWLVLNNILKRIRGVTNLILYGWWSCSYWIYILKCFKQLFEDLQLAEKPIITFVATKVLTLLAHPFFIKLCSSYISTKFQRFKGNPNNSIKNRWIPYIRVLGRRVCRDEILFWFKLRKF